MIAVAQDLLVEALLALELPEGSHLEATELHAEHLANAKHLVRMARLELVRTDASPPLSPVGVLAAAAAQEWCSRMMRCMRPGNELCAAASEQLAASSLQMVARLMSVIDPGALCKLLGEAMQQHPEVESVVFRFVRREEGCCGK